MFKKVVWATDGSDAAAEALPVARALAAEGGREMLVVHCVELTMPGKAAGRYPIHVDEGELEEKITSARDLAVSARNWSGGMPG